MKQIDLHTADVRANNIDESLPIEKINDGSIRVNMQFRHLAHLTVRLFESESLLDTHKLSMSFDARVQSGTVELWASFGESHADWHSPQPLGKLNTSWQKLRLVCKDYAALSNSFKVLKLIIRNNCLIELRKFKIHGPLGIELLNIIVPWFGNDPKRIDARDIALDHLYNQNLPFELTVVELIGDKQSATFRPSSINQKHILVKKDRRFSGIFHKESLFNYYINLHPIIPTFGYVFLDADVYADNNAWLHSIAERLSDAMEKSQALLLQPFNRVIDTVSGNTHYSYCRAEKNPPDSIAINPGLCWATFGKVIIDKEIRFPNKLVTGIADAVFAMNHTTISDQIPYIPHFAAPSIRADRQCDWDYLDENLNHVGHGDVHPESYAMRDLLWQAVIDQKTIHNERFIWEDSDGFAYISANDVATQNCISHMMTLKDSDAVLSVIRRNFGSPKSHIQHISFIPEMDISNDPRLLDAQSRMRWELARAHFRLYSLGVEQTITAKDNDPKQSKITPLREIVSNAMSHSVILLTADGCIPYPSLLNSIDTHLSETDLVFYSATPETYNNSRQKSLEIAIPPEESQHSEKESKIAAVAFSKSWWHENQIAIPHGLHTFGSSLDCLFQLVRHHFPRIMPVAGHCRLLLGGDLDTQSDSHNFRVTENILALHSQGFLSMQSIESNRRKIRMESTPISAGITDALKVLESQDGVVLNPDIITWFCDKNCTREPYKEKWIGIVHGAVEYTDSTLHKGNQLETLLNNKNFKSSLDTCVGLFTHADCLAHQTLNSPLWDASIPIATLPSTTSQADLGFRAEWFSRQPNPGIIGLGLPDLRLNTFFDLQANGYKKILLIPHQPKFVDEHLNAESMSQQTPASVIIQPWPDHISYNDLLTRNPVYLDYKECLNYKMLIECLVRNTPMILRRHPVAEEILGRNYPLFFSTLDEATASFNEANILDGHVYLAKMDKRRFYHNALTVALENSEIYQCL